MHITFLLTFAVGLFITYPAAVLTTFIEGQTPSAIYALHLPTSIFSYFLIATPIVYLFRNKFVRPNLSKEFFVTLAIVLVYAALVFTNLNQATIAGDDYDLAYQAYNLHDGILAARKAFVLSFNTHPPLFMTIKHYWFQLLFPNGLETIPPWGYRGLEGILGVGIILSVYAITKNYWATALLAVNNYLVFMGRVYLREIYLTFFMTLSIYFFQKKKYLIMAFLMGCALLIKTSAVVLLIPYALILAYQKEYRTLVKTFLIVFIMYLPVVIYNIAAFVTVGQMDATFSKVFNFPHPFLTGSSDPITNLFMIKNILSDIYSWPLLFLFILATFFSLRNNRLYILVISFSILYFTFSGPLREYYLLFLTIPFVILSAKFPKFILIPMIAFSLWYSIFGNSTVRAIYEPVRVIGKIDYRPGNCLEKGYGVNDLFMRAYFQTDDGVKKAIIGPDYPHYYKMCNEVEYPTNKIMIYYNQL